MNPAFFTESRLGCCLLNSSKTKKKNPPVNLPPVLFWDIRIENLDWDKHSQWIIQRVFEYGGEEKIRKIIALW